MAVTLSSKYPDIPYGDESDIRETLFLMIVCAETKWIMLQAMQSSAGTMNVRLHGCWMGEYLLSLYSTL